MCTDKQIPVIGSGTKACVVRPSWSNEDRKVSKIFVTREGLLSQSSEVNTSLLSQLRILDPDRMQFAYALPQDTYSLAPSTEMQIEDSKECKQILQKKEDLVETDFVKLTDIRWFDLDDLTDAPAEFSMAQKNHLREALKILHKSGYAHNDIQRGNIMIHKVDGLPRLIDFGEVTQDDLPRRILNDNDRLEALFQEASVDPRVSRGSKTRSRLRDADESAASFQMSSLFAADPELSSALFSSPERPGGGKKSRM